MDLSSLEKLISQFPPSVGLAVKLGREKPNALTIGEFSRSRTVRNTWLACRGMQIST